MARIAKKTAAGRRGKNRSETGGRSNGAKKHSSVASPVTAIVKNRERNLNPSEIDLLKKTVAKGTDDQEFMLFMLICRKHRLDPFTKQVYCIIWPTNSGQSHEMVIVTGINGYRAMAARSHPDFGGSSAATFVMSKEKTPAGRTIPECATVEVYRKNGPTSTCTVYWEEFAPADLHAKRSDFWNRLPKHMLAKCAESQALRKAFPNLSDIYTEEEISQKLQDYTEEGRQIHTDGVAPSGSVVDQREAAKSEQRRILNEKLPHGHAPGTRQAKQAEAVLDRVEKEDVRLAAAKNVTPSSGKQEAKPETTTASAGKKSEVGASSLAGTTLINGNLLSVVAYRAQNGAEVRDVLIGGTHYKCFHKSLFKYLDQFGRMGGFTIHAHLDARKTIDGLKKIGPIFFEDDGKTEKVAEREPGVD